MSKLDPNYSENEEHKDREEEQEKQEEREKREDREPEDQGDKVDREERDEENHSEVDEEEKIEELHPLENVWRLTYKPKVQHTKKQQSEDDWLSSFQTVYSDIKSVEMFWCVKNNIPSWSHLQHGSIYAFFKNDINPSWEDEQNKDGCSYMFYFNQNRMAENDLDNVFELSLLFLIGECSKYSSHVNGITFERKFRGDKMIVWCNAHSKDMLESIKNEILPDNLKDNCCMDATEHNDSRYKVGIKVVDHKAELQRIKVVNRHSK